MTYGNIYGNCRACGEPLAGPNPDLFCAACRPNTRWRVTNGQREQARRQQGARLWRLSSVLVGITAAIVLLGAVGACQERLVEGMPLLAWIACGMGLAIAALLCNLHGRLEGSTR